jgi:hypothetical protein
MFQTNFSKDKVQDVLLQSKYRLGGRDQETLVTHECSPVREVQFSKGEGGDVFVAVLCVGSDEVRYLGVA